MYITYSVGNVLVMCQNTRN